MLGRRNCIEKRRERAVFEFIEVVGVVQINAEGLKMSSHGIHVHTGTNVIMRGMNLQFQHEVYMCRWDH